jgi:hypothetical protein
MTTLKSTLTGLIISFISSTSIGQINDFDFRLKPDLSFTHPSIILNIGDQIKTQFKLRNKEQKNKGIEYVGFDFTINETSTKIETSHLHKRNLKLDFNYSTNGAILPVSEVGYMENEPFVRNRRNVYSSLWAFATLNYLYADVVGLMDKNVLAEYQEGNVGGTEITPGFLTLAGAFMQIPIANVFLPQVIKNERTLKWVQIASGTIMSLAQAGTLFAGEPTPYYVLFSAIEIAATSYIAIDAIKWKPISRKKRLVKKK